MNADELKFVRSVYDKLAFVALVPEMKADTKSFTVIESDIIPVTRKTMAPSNAEFEAVCEWVCAKNCAPEGIIGLSHNKTETLFISPIDFSFLREGLRTKFTFTFPGGTP